MSWRTCSLQKCPTLIQQQQPARETRLYWSKHKTRSFKASAAYMYQQCCMYLEAPQSRHILNCIHDLHLGYSLSTAAITCLLTAFMYNFSSAVYDLLTQDSGPGLLSVHPTAAYLCTACPCCWNADAVAAISADCSYLWQHATGSPEHVLSADLG
jgi:hypothetical protein